MLIYIYGDTWLGKTHWAFENAETCLDTAENNEGLFKKFKDKKNYIKLKSIDETIDIGESNIIALDTLYGLKELGKQKYLREFDKKVVYPVTEWGYVYDYMQEFLERFVDKTIIIVTRLKPLYNKKSIIVGKEIDMPAIFNFHADIMLHMKIVENKRVFGVYKDRYKDPLEYCNKQIEVIPLTELLKVLV